MIMTILQAGPLTTIQDAGRFGLMEYGIGQSGVMDYQSYRQVNQLVGNDKNEAVLEMTLMGSEILFDEETLIAYTGADMQAKLDEVPIERGRAYLIQKGQRLKFGMAKSGVRAYLAIAGEMQVPVIINSKSTNLKCKMGGLDGRKLQNGDELKVQVRKYSKKKTEKLLKKQMEPTDYEEKKMIRVVLGPQDDCFSEKGIKTFLSEDYIVSMESDRMGIRMEGPKIEGKGKTDIVSDGIVFGSIQVTSAGLPIAMMADHQTTGGYAKIATVVKEDLPKLAQARPGDHVVFQKVEIEEIQKKRFFLFDTKMIATHGA
ncbi:MAG: biotin-dependent carboxyltransferase family protein [Lachnospiraceae bacterium]|nr:biotin-dependent carboxyltransferase family protein [Lachnospiraceae bacterium]